MKNFSITKDGKEYWIARNVAVVSFIFTKSNGEWYILANKRGKGTPDFQGCWNCPCGYLDFDETLTQACARETREECGIIVRPNEFKFVSIEDSPITSGALQNVTARHYAIIENDREIGKKFTGGEDNEVDEVTWIPVKNVFSYKWAFNHDYRILEIFENYVR